MIFSFLNTSCSAGHSMEQATFGKDPLVCNLLKTEESISRVSILQFGNVNSYSSPAVQLFPLEKL